MTETAKLTASNGNAKDFFGGSVAVSGNTIVVGSPPNNSDVKAAYVFTKPNGGWANATESAKLTASDGKSGDNFGSSVAIDGGTVVVAPQFATVGSNEEQGAAYVFSRSPCAGWANAAETVKLTATNGAAGSFFGDSASVSGSTVVIGAPGMGTSGNPSQGAAYIFTEPGSGWAGECETAELMEVNPQTDDYFGSSVSISGVNTIAVGARGVSSAQGAVDVFSKPLSGWANMTPTATLTVCAGHAEAFGTLVVAIRRAATPWSRALRQP